MLEWFSNLEPHHAIMLIVYTGGFILTLIITSVIDYIDREKSHTDAEYGQIISVSIFWPLAAGTVIPYIVFEILKLPIHLIESVAKHILSKEQNLTPEQTIEWRDS